MSLMLQFLTGLIFIITQTCGWYVFIWYKQYVHMCWWMTRSWPLRRCCHSCVCWLMDKKLCVKVTVISWNMRNNQHRRKKQQQTTTTNSAIHNWRWRFSRIFFFVLFPSEMFVSLGYSDWSDANGWRNMELRCTQTWSLSRVRLLGFFTGQVGSVLLLQLSTSRWNWTEEKKTKVEL